MPRTLRTRGTIADGYCRGAFYTNHSRPILFDRRCCKLPAPKAQTYVSRVPAVLHEWPEQNNCDVYKQDLGVKRELVQSSTEESDFHVLDSNIVKKKHCLQACLESGDQEGCNSLSLLGPHRRIFLSSSINSWYGRACVLKTCRTEGAMHVAV